MKVKNILLVLALTYSFVSCRTVKNITEHRGVPNITENRLFKSIYDNELEYNTLYAKRLDISVVQGDESKNLKASLKLKKDNFIQVSVTAPLGIEVARILLTPDSIKFINSFNKSYFVSDYHYFSDKFDVNVSFDCFQKILTNTFFNFENCSGNSSKEQNYKFDKTDNGYVLSTIEEKTLSRKIKKLYKKKRKNKDYALILQKIEFDPLNFRPVKMSVEDMEEHMGVSVDYFDFKDFSGKIFPEKIVFNLFSDSGKTGLEIKFVKLEFNTEMESNFKISSKYKRIK